MAPLDKRVASFSTSSSLFSSNETSTLSTIRSSKIFIRNNGHVGHVANNPLWSKDRQQNPPTPPSTSGDIDTAVLGAIMSVVALALVVLLCRLFWWRHYRMRLERERLDAALLAHARREAALRAMAAAANRGVEAARAVEEALANFDASSVVTESSCAVCLEKMDAGGVVAAPCLHALHVECWRGWLVKDSSRACPICRAPVEVAHPVDDVASLDAASLEDARSARDGGVASSLASFHSDHVGLAQQHVADISPAASRGVAVAAVGAVGAVGVGAAGVAGAAGASDENVAGGDGHGHGNVGFSDPTSPPSLTSDSFVRTPPSRRLLSRTDELLLDDSLMPPASMDSFTLPPPPTSSSAANSAAVAAAAAATAAASATAIGLASLPSSTPTFPRVRRLDRASDSDSDSGSNFNSNSNSNSTSISTSTSTPTPTPNANANSNSNSNSNSDRPPTAPT